MQEITDEIGYQDFPKGADEDLIELQGAAEAPSTDQPGACTAQEETKTTGMHPKITKFLQPDGSIWEYQDMYMEADGWKDNLETCVEDQYHEEIVGEREGDKDLLII